MSPVSPEIKNWKGQKRKREEWKTQKSEKKLQRELKKKKLQNKIESEATSQNGTVSSSNKGELHTLSIAVAGSIIDNAQTPELKTYLAGQIARAACIFNVDEVVVFDDLCTSYEEDRNGNKQVGHGCLKLARLLQYLECPQYLRKHMFPIHKDLRFAGVLNPLDAPHHLRQQDESMYREGIVVFRPIDESHGSYVNIGLQEDIIVDRTLKPGLRVTVKLQGKKKRRGIVVSPSLPRTESGLYWGYNVRLAASLSKVFSQCPYKGGYDLTIGTSDKGKFIHESLPSSQHVLIVFGGLQGLEDALYNDKELNAEDPGLLFDMYVNTCPNQGSRTIRTEEAILISLSSICSKLSSV